jgi:sulfur-oxidizing protein SoxY
MKRRLFLKQALGASGVLAAVSAGLLSPTAVFANSAQFKSLSAVKLDSAKSAAKGAFKFKAPKIAENGAVVPVTIDASKLDDVTNISILIENNSTPLAASFDLSNARGFVSTRIKMGKSSDVHAMVTAGGTTSVVSQLIKVTVGGCGG